MGMRDWAAKIVRGGASVSEKRSFSRFPFLVRTQEASRKRWGDRRQLTLEPLEPRLMLNATLAPGDFTLENNGANALAGAVLLGTGTTGGVTAVVSSAANGQTVTGIQVVLPTHVGVGTYTVDLAMSGTAGAAPNVTVAGMNAGDKITLQLDLDQINNGDGAADYGSLSSNVNGFATSAGDTGYIADTNYTGPAPATVVTNPTLGPTGGIGTTDIPVSIGGGLVDMLNTGSGSIARMTLDGGIDLTGGAALTVAQESYLTGSGTGITVLGNTTLAGNALAIFLNDSTGNPPLSLSAAGTITLNGTGGLTVETLNGYTPGAETFGNFVLSSSGAVNIETSNNANLAGQITIGTIGISGSGGVTVAPSGSGDFAAGVTIGQITDTSTAGAGVEIDGSSIGGAVSIAGFDATGAGSQNGFLDIEDGGAAGNIGLGTLNIEDSAVCHGHRDRHGRRLHDRRHHDPAASARSG